MGCTVPRAGISAEVVVRRAIAIADEHGPAALTLARVASELGVSAPSLYKHVDGLDDLLDRAAAMLTAELAAQLGMAIRGRSGRDGLSALADAYRAFAHTHSGTYPLTQRRLNSPEWRAAADDSLASLVAVLSSYGVPADDIDRIRVVRATLHGFVDLERTGGFGLAASIDETFPVLVDVLDIAIRSSGSVPLGR